MIRLTIASSLFALSVFAIAGAARAQTYFAGASGCTNVTSGSPVSVSGCESYAGCAGTNALTSVNHASAGPVEVSAGYSMTTRWWQNFCGDAAYAGGGGEWTVPVVFTGPGPNVTIQVQADYEYTFDYMPTGAAHQSPLDTARFDVSVGAPQAGGTEGTFLVNGNGVFNWIGATITPIDADSFTASGRIVSVPMGVPTGVPVPIRISLVMSLRAGAPQVPESWDTWEADGTIRPPATGPVFILPEGYTANSPALGIVNNQFVPPACDGDANGDNTVDGADLSVLLGQFGQSVTPGTGADLNEDGVVNAADLSVLLGRFGTSC